MSKKTRILQIVIPIVLTRKLKKKKNITSYYSVHTIKPVLVFDSSAPYLHIIIQSDSPENTTPRFLQY